jgi:UDP-3-O-[3-hydroxymyristoyl] glucosamine N-acyltransferase
MSQYTLKQIAELTGGQIVGENDTQITGVNSLEAASAGDITFLSDAKHEPKLRESNAGAVIVSKVLSDFSKPQLVMDKVDAGLIAVLKLFAPKLQEPVAGIHPTAIVDKSAKIAASASIGPYVFVEKNASIGEKSVVSAGCRVGENSLVGTNCRIDSNVVIYHNCRIGNSVIIQANSTIGSVGFGYSYFNNQHNLIPHNGGVVIEDFVEIGANCCVDRAKFGNTVIGAGTKIDNLVQIAHNVTLGKCCLVVAQVGIAGSSRLGNGVVLGGQAGVSDHSVIGDGTMVAASSSVLGEIPAGQKVGGTPAMDLREAIRIAMATQRLPDLIKQVKELSQKVTRLETAKDNTK